MHNMYKHKNIRMLLFCTLSQDKKQARLCCTVRYGTLIVMHLLRLPASSSTTFCSSSARPRKKSLGVGQLICSGTATAETVHISTTAYFQSVAMQCTACSLSNAITPLETVRANSQVLSAVNCKTNFKYISTTVHTNCSNTLHCLLTVNYTITALTVLKQCKQANGCSVHPTS
jgi:hypothetical protein